MQKWHGHDRIHVRMKLLRHNNSLQGVTITVPTSTVTVMRRPGDCSIPVRQSFHVRNTTIRTLPVAVDVQSTVRSTLNATCTVSRNSAATWLLSASIIQRQVRRRLSTAHSTTVVSVQLVKKLTCNVTWQRCNRNIPLNYIAVEFLHYLQCLGTEVYRPSVISSPLSCALWRWDSLGVATCFPIAANDLDPHTRLDHLLMP
jgi:hypothetical protein